MALYKAGKLIKQIRLAKKETRESLSEKTGISVRTIERIENTSQRMKSVTIGKILPKLLPGRERYFAVCSTAEIGIIDEKDKIQINLAKKNFDEAVALLDVVEKKLDNEGLTNKQYLLWKKSYIAFRNGEKSAQSALVDLENALKITTPDYKKYVEDETSYPYLLQELGILMNIAELYKSLGKYQESEQIYLYIIKCISSGYASGKNIRQLNVINRLNYTKRIQNGEGLAMAIDILEKQYLSCRNLDYSLGTLGILYDLAWCQNEYNKLKGIEKYDREKIKSQLRDAYYLAIAINYESIKKHAQDYFLKEFGHDITE
jgi:transcriptional regulator with XRE-family HTH domain